VSYYETATRPPNEMEQRGGGFLISVGDNYVARTKDVAQLPSYRKSQDGGVLTGYATRYMKAIFHCDKYKVVMPGAFSKWIQSNARIRFLLNHDDNKCVGSTDDGLELYADRWGIAFRFRLPDTPLGREVKLLAESEMLQAMSIGFDHMRVEYKQIEGENVCLLHDGELHEISFLKRGAVRDAYCALVDEDECGPTLAGDCLKYPHRLFIGGLYIKTMRTVATFPAD
jgi:HK97 family phage prohead protease